MTRRQRATAPFYAYPFNASFPGTKGGPRTNDGGQVLGGNGEVIAGLYAAGNVMATPFDTKAVGAGTSLVALSDLGLHLRARSARGAESFGRIAY